ncbi:MAG: FkbM family methyltransferase [Myxococcota bacterium]
MLTESRSFRKLVRLMFRVKGLRVVAHALRRRLARPESVWIDDFDGDLAFLCRLDEHIGSQMYWRGAYSWSQLRVLDRLLQPDMVFADVGANQGEFTLFAAKRLPRGRVLAFEPMTEMRERLVGNLAANPFDNVLVSDRGLWSEPGRRRIFRRDAPFADGSFHEGLGTLFPTAERSDAVEEIALTTLDAFLEQQGIDRVDVLKVDVEGAELEVLRGAEKTLERCRPLLLLEADRDCAEAAGGGLEALLGWLAPRYRFERVGASGRTRAVEPAALGRHQDLLCIPR